MKCASDPFIEKALFITRILDAGFKGVVVHRATGVNDTLIYKMKAIVSAIPENLIRGIGPAHGAGQRQWETLAAFCRNAKPAYELRRVEQAVSSEPSATGPGALNWRLRRLLRKPLLAAKLVSLCLAASRQAIPRKE